MAQEKKTSEAPQEPSMEDILASIRRILSEEGEDKAQAPAAAGEEASDPQPAELEEVAIDEGPASTPVDDEAWEALPADDASPATAREPDPDIELADRPRPAGGWAADNVLELTPAMRVGPVLSAPTAAASTDVLSQLAKAILDRRDIAVGSRDLTLEGMVREMMRPLLKEWLDRNLPYLIERLVKREIDGMINRAERLED